MKLKHGTITAVRDNVRLAGMWNTSMEKVIRSIITECGCHLGDTPTQHRKVVARPPTDLPQALVSIDVIKLEVRNFLHSVD